MTLNELIPCHRCKGRTAQPTELKSTPQAFVQGRGGECRSARLIFCPECLAELEQIAERAETGGPAAKEALRREQARIWKIVFEAAGDE